MNKYMKAAGLLLIPAIAMGGCRMNSESPRAAVLAALEEKYDDKFTVTDSYGGGIGVSSKALHVQPDGHPDWTVAVQYDTSGDGTVFYDNYTQLRFFDETEDLLRELLDEIFGTEVFLSYTVNEAATVNSFTEETTFEEYIRDPRAGIEFRAVVSNEFAADDLNEVLEDMQAVLDRREIVIAGMDVCLAYDEESFRPFEELNFKQRSEMRRIRLYMNGPGSYYRCETKG